MYKYETEAMPGQEGKQLDELKYQLIRYFQPASIIDRSNGKVILQNLSESEAEAKADEYNKKEGRL